MAQPRSPVEDRSSATGPIRIVVTGSEGTGKTSLVQQLAKHLAAPWVSEYARGYAESVRRALGPQDIEPIARGQISLEDSAVASHPTVLILDTDLISTVVYARHYYENVPHWLEVAARERLADLYLLLDIDVDWVADGVRDQPQARAGIHKRFQEQLRDFGARVVEIRGLGPARLEAALRTIEGHLATRT